MLKVTAVGAGLLALVLAGAAQAAGLGAERVNGSYVREKDPTRSGLVTVLMTNKGTLRIVVDVANLYGGYNNGTGTGEAKLRGNEATFSPEGGGAGCKLSVTFAPGDTVVVSQDGDVADCGFGHGVYADGRYVKARGGKLPFFELPGSLPDAKALTQRSSDAAAEAQAASPAIAAKAARVAELATSRKALKDALAKSKKELEARSRAGAAAAKKRDAAFGKPQAQPSAATLGATAQAEYTAAQSAGREAVKIAAQLRAVEDELAQLAAETNQAAVDAKLGLADLKKAQKALKTLASKERDEAKKTATSAQQDATKSATLVGVSPAQLEPKRAKARTDDAKLSADAVAARASLKEVEASLKGAK